jgi:hypothetical protein
MAKVKQKKKDDISTFIEDVFWFPFFYIFIVIGLPTFIIGEMVYSTIMQNNDWGLYALILFPLGWIFFTSYFYWRKMQ